MFAPPKIEIKPPLHCHIWQGATTNGNPVMRIEGRVQQVRRVVYERLKRELMPRERVKMECGERLCVRVDHMRAVLHGHPTPR